MHLRGHLRRTWELAPGNIGGDSGLIPSQEDKAHPWDDGQNPLQQADFAISSSKLFEGCALLHLSAQAIDYFAHIVEEPMPEHVDSIVRPLDSAFVAVATASTLGAPSTDATNTHVEAGSRDIFHRPSKNPH